VIDGELRGGHPLSAVLAHAVVAEEKVAPVRAKEAAGDLDVGEKADDHHVLTKATPCHCLLDRLPGNVVNESDALFGQQDDQPPLTDHIQRLK
jgi:hypothetical protein